MKKATNAKKPAKSKAKPESATAAYWEIGSAYLIRTVTMTITGRLIAVHEHELALEDAAWIADTGRFADALRTGSFSEVEPFPAGPVLVGRGSIVDACRIAFPLPRVQK